MSAEGYQECNKWHHDNGMVKGVAGGVVPEGSVTRHGGVEETNTMV